MKKNGFTLIELIATIVILSLIAAISIPTVINVINDSREKNFKNSANNIIQAAKQYFLNSELTNDTFEEITFTVVDNKMMSNGKELKYDGIRLEHTSFVRINKNGDIEIYITDGVYCARKSYTQTEISFLCE